MGCLAMPDQCGNCIRLSRLPRLLGNVMRLLKWGPGPEGEGPPPLAGRGAHSFSETQSCSADRDRPTRFAWKPDPEGLEWGLLLGRLGRGRQEWGAGPSVWGQESLRLPGWTSPSLHVTKGYTESQRHRGSHSKVNRRYPKRPARLLQP